MRNLAVDIISSLTFKKKNVMFIPDKKSLLIIYSCILISCLFHKLIGSTCDFFLDIQTFDPNVHREYYT